MKRSAMLAAALMCVCSPIIAQSELDSNSNTEWNLNSNQDPNSLQSSEIFDLAPNPRSELSNRSTSRRSPEAITAEPSQKLELPVNNSVAPIVKPESNPSGLPTGHRLHQRSLIQGNSVANTVPNYQHSQGNFYPGHDSEFLPFGSPTNSPLLNYMQCDTYGQAAWAGYPCERARALASQFSPCEWPMQLLEWMSFSFGSLLHRSIMPTFVWRSESISTDLRSTHLCSTCKRM